MPKRFEPKVREALFQQIAKRDGEWCLHCGFWPARDGPAGPQMELEIDHADNDTTNWDADNLHILCNHCNLEMRKFDTDTKLLILWEDCDKNIYVTQTRKNISNTELLKLKVDYTEGKTEARINNYCEVKFRDFALLEVRKRGAIKKDELTDAGAEEVGCSIDAVTKYLRKLTSYKGPLQAVKTETGWIVTVRTNEQG